MATQTLPTAAALRVTGLDPATWLDAIRHDLFPDLPRTTPGRQRRFDRDDLIGLMIFRELLAIGISRKHAAGIASDVRAVLRARESVETLAIVKGVDATKQPCAAVVITPPADSLVLMKFSIARLRAAADLAFASSIQ